MRAEGRAVDTVQAANTTRAPPDTAAPARREEEEADGSPEAGGVGRRRAGRLRQERRPLLAPRAVLAARTGGIPGQ